MLVSLEFRAMRRVVFFGDSVFSKVVRPPPRRSAVHFFSEVAAQIKLAKTGASGGVVAHVSIDGPREPF